MQSFRSFHRRSQSAGILFSKDHPSPIYTRGRSASASEKIYNPELLEEPANLEMAKDLFDLGVREIESGNTRKAKRLLEQVLKFYQEYYGSDHPETGNVLMRLGDVELEMGNGSKAEELLQCALSIFVKHGKDYLPKVAIVLTSLSDVEGQFGDERKKIELLEQALVAEKDFYGPNHCEVAKTLVDLAKLVSIRREHIFTREVVGSFDKDENLL